MDFDDGHLQSSSNHQYSTIKDLETDEEDSEEYYRYKVSSSGGKRKKPGILTSGSNHKHRYKKPFSPSPALEPYLSPPVGSYDPTINFRRPGGRRRPQANRKQADDQYPSGSDVSPSEVTVPPPVRMRNLTATVTAKLPNADSKRVNYNYHPIIDFFDKDKSQLPYSVDRIGNANQRNAWRPMVNRRG